MSASAIVMTPRQLCEFLLCQASLQGVLLYVAKMWPPASLEITRVHSTAEENSATGATTEIHVEGPPYRAIDIRVRNLPGDPQKAADAIGELVNHTFIYDPGRPGMRVAVTAPHGSGPHIHLQVSAKTVRRDQIGVTA